MAEFDPDAFLGKPSGEFNPDAFLKSQPATAPSTAEGWIDWGLSKAKQLPLGVARGVGNMVAAGAPAGMGEALAANPKLYDILEQRGEKVPTPEDYKKFTDEQLVNLGVNSPGNMPKDLTERMISGAGESIPWSAAMGPIGGAANIGLGMVGGAAAPFAEEHFGGDTQEGKATAGIIGNLVGTFGAAGALGIAKGIYNALGAPMRRLPGEFNLPATRGMLMPEDDVGRIAALTEEQSMEKGARGPLARRIMDQTRNTRNREIEQTRYQDLLNNESATATPLAAGEQVTGALQSEARALEAQGNEVYNAARTSNPTRIISEQNQAIPAVDQSLRAQGVTPQLLPSYPSAHRARNMIEDMQARMQNVHNQTSPQQYTAQFNDMWQTLKDIRKIRATNAADGEILGNVRNSYHDWMRNTLDNVLFTGDREIIDNIAQADSIWRRLRMITDVDHRNPARDYTRLTSAIWNEAKTPDEVAQYLLNINSVGGASKASRLAQSLRDTFGAGSDVWNSIRAGALHKALLADRPEKNGIELANAIRNFTRGNGAPLARTVLEGPELERLQGFERALRSTHPPSANPSGSGYEVGRTVWHMILGAVGLTEIASGMHMAPTKWALAGGIPIIMMLNNARKALHATRETMQGPGVMGRLPIAGIGAMNEATQSPGAP